MALILAGPLVSLSAWNAFTWYTYGRPHFIAMALFEQGESLPLILRTIAAMCALGLGVLPLASLFLFSGAHRKRTALAWGISMVFLPGAYWIARQVDLPQSSALLFAVGIVLTVLALFLSSLFALECFRDRDGKAAMLAIWILFGLAFQAGLMFSAVRYLLFLAPPFVLLLLRLGGGMQSSSRSWTVIGFSLVLVLAIAIGDAKIAESYRWVAREHISHLRAASQEKLFFSGHLGFQYYMEQLGGRHIVRSQVDPPSLRGGDVVVVAATPWPPLTRPPVREGQVLETRIIPYNPRWPLRTIDCATAASFHGSLLSHCPRPAFLPWGFNSSPSEWFYVFFIGD